MRWTLRVGLLCLGLLIAYTAWPFVDLYRLGRAIERRDAAAVIARVELRALRPSVSRQVIATYLQLTGREAKLGGFMRDVVAGAGAAFVDPALEELLSNERVLDFLADGLAGVVGPDGSTRQVDLAPRNLGGLWDLYVNSDYKLQNFYVAVPPGAPPAQRFRLRLRLMQWTWKLYEIELSEPIRVRLAEQIIKQTDKR